MIKPRGDTSRLRSLQSVASRKTCTDNPKIKPNYQFLADYLRVRYGYGVPGNRFSYGHGIQSRI